MSDNPIHMQDFVVHKHFFDLYDQIIGDIYIPDALLNVANVVCKAMNAERATIYLVEHDTQELQSAVVLGNVARTIRIPIDKNSIAGFCASTRLSFVIPDAYEDLSWIDPALCFDKHWDAANNYRTRDVMCAPSIFKDQLMGVIQVINSRGQPFHEKNLDALKSISRLVAYALYYAQMYDELATMKQLKKQNAEFMRIMVHELKAPVAAVKMLLDALQYQTDAPKLSSLTARIAERMDQMNRLILDILDLARIKAGGPLGEIQVLDLAAETNAICQQYREQAEAKGLSFKTDLPETPVPVRIDPRGCRLILSNLVSNAVKYTLAGAVAVTLTAAEPWAVVDVKDTGLGIPEADLPKLFQEFFRASNVRGGNIQGTGVGLAGVKELVDRFRGEMSLESREHVGSHFTIRLPLAVEGMS